MISGSPGSEWRDLADRGKAGASVTAGDAVCTLLTCIEGDTIPRPLAAEEVLGGTVSGASTLGSDVSSMRIGMSVKMELILASS